MNNLDVKELLGRLDERSIHMEEKIDTILNHLEKLNGRVGKTEEQIGNLKEWRAESRGHWKAASVIGSGIGGVVGFIISHFISK